MPNLVRRSASVQTSDPNEALSCQIARAQAPALVAAARIQAVGFAADVGLQQAERLQIALNRAFTASPAGEAVYQALFAAYGAVAVSEIQRLGIHQDGSF